MNTCPNQEQLLAYLRGQPGSDLLSHLEACLACQAELPRRFPPLKPLPDALRPHWLTCREEEFLAAEGGQRGFDPRPQTPADPLFQIDALLRDRLGTRFQLVRAVSFTNQGPPRR